MTPSQISLGRFFSRLLLLASLASALPAAAQSVTRLVPDGKPHRFELRDRQFFLDGEPTLLVAGEMHFGRVLPEDWELRLAQAKLTAAERTEFWTAAIARARGMFGERWGLALNGDEARSQCHTHVHIGRLREDVEDGQPQVVAGPADIPVPKDGSGMWIHLAGDKLHVHLGEQGTEGVLER